MSPTVHGRGFLTVLGAELAGLSGCLGNLPGSSSDVNRATYVGAYHWWFIVVDESGEERDRISLQRNDGLRVVSFNTLANDAPSCTSPKCHQTRRSTGRSDPKRRLHAELPDLLWLRAPQHGNRRWHRYPGIGPIV